MRLVRSWPPLKLSEPAPSKVSKAPSIGTNSFGCIDLSSPQISLFFLFFFSSFLSSQIHSKLHYFRLLTINQLFQQLTFSKFSTSSLASSSNLLANLNALFDIINFNNIMPFSPRRFFKSCFGTTEKAYEPVRVLPHPVHGYVGDTLSPGEKETLAFISSHRPESPTNRDQSVRVPNMPRPVLEKVHQGTKIRIQRLCLCSLSRFFL
jgi:hypothetical protein